MARVALVTGSGRNIGRAVALRLAGCGMTVVVNVRASVEEGEEVLRQVQGLGVEAMLAVADVSDPEHVRRMSGEVRERFGGVDVLVNNVGIAPMSRLDETTDEQWDLVLRTSLFSAFYCTRAFVAGMRERRWGRIVNVGGLAGLRGTKYKSANAAAKAGLIGLTRATANEFGEYGITCNHVGPGQLERQHDVVYYADRSDELDPDYHRRWRERIPVGRPGTFDEVAAVCSFLASDEASYVTGQTILVNGGVLSV